MVFADLLHGTQQNATIIENEYQSLRDHDKKSAMGLNRVSSEHIAIRWYQNTNLGGSSGCTSYGLNQQ